MTKIHHMKLEDFKTGDIILFHTKFVWYKPLSWLSALIRFFTKSYYNHVGVVVRNWDVPFINEAVETGVHAVPLVDRIGSHQIRVIRPIKGVDERTFAVRANSKIGHTGYDFSGLLFYQLIFQLTGHWLGHTGVHAEGVMYCGEYAGFCHAEYFHNYWKTAPSDENKSEYFFEVYRVNSFKF